MNKQKKWIINITILLLSIGITLYYVFRGEDLGELLQMMKEADYRWCVFGIICVVVFMLSESLVIWVLMRPLPQQSKLSHCILYSLVGFFFSAVTPSASGGQPMQVYFMRKDGISASVSIPVLTIMTILYKGVLILIGCSVMIVRPVRLMKYLDPCIPWIYLGIALNIIFVTGLLLLIFKPEIIRNIAMSVIRFGEQVLHIKKTANLYPRVEQWCCKYVNVTQCFRKDGKMIAFAFLITLFQRLTLFSITWMCCKAFGIDRYQFVFILALQAMIAVAVDMLPLPGGTGISESLFLKIFTPLLGGAFNLPVMVMSRGLSYYSQILVGSIFTIVAMILLDKETIRSVGRRKGQKKE